VHDAQRPGERVRSRRHAAAYWGQAMAENVKASPASEVLRPIGERPLEAVRRFADVHRPAVERIRDELGDDSVRGTTAS